MPFIISPLFINTSNLKGSPCRSTKHTHPDLSKWMDRYNTRDTSAYKGKRTYTLSSPNPNNPYYEERQKIVYTIMTRITRMINKAGVNPTIATMLQEGSNISRYSLMLRLAISNLCDAVTKLKQKNLTKLELKQAISTREACFYHINTHYLSIMRELYGSDTVYQNHKDIACSDHFIAEENRRFGRRIK